MSNNDCILKLLNLKDKNIIFEENYCDRVVIKNVESIILFGKLVSKPHTCPYCGNNHDSIIVQGYKESTIILPKVSGLNTYLKLNKQRYKCKNCYKTFIAKTTIVNKNCFISNNTKLQIALDSTKKRSETDIAQDHNVSNNTVSRVMKSFQDNYTVNFNYLPETLCFDEFKSTKDADGAMSFVYADGDTHKIIDIVENRRLGYLKTYFFRYTRKARKRVKYIVIDMYSPYITLIKACFPNAQIIFDRFHIVNLISKSLNKTRIKVMNNKKDCYNKFKRYWKLLLKDCRELDRTNYKNFICFKGTIREYDIVEYLLERDEELRNTYIAYQNFLIAIRTRDHKKLSSLISDNYNNVSEPMKTSIKTIKKYSQYILNAVKYKYSNGVIEGINNKTKVIKRIAFGYRSFVNFRTRILIMNNMILTA